MSRCSAAGIGFREVGGIQMGVKNHAGCIVSDFCIRVSMEVVEEVFWVFDCMFGGF